MISSFVFEPPNEYGWLRIPRFSIPLGSLFSMVPLSKRLLLSFLFERRRSMAMIDIVEHTCIFAFESLFVRCRCNHCSAFYVNLVRSSRHEWLGRNRGIGLNISLDVNKIVLNLCP